MARQPGPEQLANLVPINEVPKGLREMLLPYSELITIGEEELFVTRAETEALYLISGSIEPQRMDGRVGDLVRAEQWQAFGPNHAMESFKRAHGGPGGARLIRIDRRRLGTVLVWHELRAAPDSPILRDEWLPAILGSELLARLPSETQQAAISRAMAREVSAGDRVVAEGDDAEHYYLILEGTFTVHRASSSGLDLLIAELGPGDSFGEEALLADAARNASVEAGSDGIILALAKSDFLELIGTRLGRSITADAALEELATGARCIDVRTVDEFARDGRPGARNVPLSELRDQRPSFLRKARHIVVCDTGRRGATAAFLMSEWGLDARSVDGGLLAIAALEGQTPAERPNLRDLQAVLETVEDALEDAVHENASLPDVSADELLDEDRTDPQLRARIDTARSHLTDAQAARLSLEQRIRDMQASNQREHAELAGLRDRLASDTTRALEEERQRLREAYDRATTTIASLRARRNDLSQQAEMERARIDADVSASQIDLDKRAADVHRALLRTRDEALARERSIRQEHVEREGALIEAVEKRLRDERSRLETQVASSVAAIQAAEARLDQLEQERAADKNRARERVAARAAKRDQWRQDMQRQIAAVSTEGRASDEDEAVRLAEVVASEESLRLKLHAEVEALLEDERAIAERGADEARRKLDYIAAQDKIARERAERTAQSEADMLSDIQSQLGATERAAGASAYATELARLAGEASDSSNRERRSAEEALERARAHIARLKSGAPPKK